MDVGADERAQAPGLAGARLRQVRVGVPGEIAQPRGGQDEAAEHPRFRRPAPPGVLRDRVFHRQRGRREEAGVVHQPLQQRPRGRGGHGFGSSHDVVVRGVLDRERLAAHEEGAEGVHHHRELARALGADRLLGPARLRAVRQPVGVERDRALLDALAAHELGVRVEQHLVRHHVLVAVGRRHRAGLEVVGPRAERADHPALALEGLVDRRGQVHAAHARLEVVDAEGPGVVVAVPAHHVEGVVRHDHLHEPVAALHHDGELAGLVAGDEALRPADVALREGRHLRELAVLVAVSLRRAHVAGALDHEEPDGRRAQPPAVQHPAGDDDVVAGPVGKVAEGRLEDALALHHEDDLVALPVAVEERVLLARARHRDRDVGVEEERHAVEDRARPGGEARGAEVPVPHHALRLRHPAEAADRPHARDRGGQAQVIEQRREAAEPLVPDELLVVERAVVLAERDVSLAGHAPQLVVDGHSTLRVREPHSIPRRSGRVPAKDCRGYSGGLPGRPGTARGQCHPEHAPDESACEGSAGEPADSSSPGETKLRSE